MVALARFAQRPSGEALITATGPAGQRVSRGQADWRREFERWLVARPGDEGGRLRPYVVTEGETPPGWADIVIVNYDRLVGKNAASLVAALQARTWDLVIADEAHVLKNAEAQRTVVVLGRPGKKARGAKPEVEAVKGLVEGARRLLFLTGTPIMNEPAELWTLIHALRPDVWADFFPFGRRYCAGYQKSIGRRTFWDFSGASHLDELQEKLRATCMVRRRKVDVLTELPPKRRELIVLQATESGEVRRLLAREEQLHAAIDGVHQELHDRADIAAALGDEVAYRNAVAALRDMPDDGDDEEVGEQRARRGPAFREISGVRHAIALQKVPAVLQHLDAVLDGGTPKLIVFAHHLDVVDAIAAHFGERAVRLDGRMEMDERQVSVDRFQRDAAVQVFVGQIQAAGVGLTLTAAAHVVFAELVYVPALVTQAEDRAHRIGQRDSVLVQHLVLDGSLDAKIAATLIAKQDIADKALDSERTLLLAAPVTVAEAKGQRGAGRPSKYPAAPTAVRAAAKAAMQMIASACDGAKAQDGEGFAAGDSAFGKSLAWSAGELTDAQTWAAVKLARKYRRQLPAHLLEALAPSESAAA